MTAILALDPGTTTGWAYYSARFDRYNFGQLDDDLVHIYNFIGKAKPTMIAVERFTHRPTMKKSELHAVEVTGVVKLWAQQNYVPVYLYLPAESKAFWNDNKIKNLSLWGPGQGHAMDAMRVLLTHRMKHEPDWFKETLRSLSE